LPWWTARRCRRGRTPSEIQARRAGRG
jgi:hypothetical protein